VTAPTALDAHGLGKRYRSGWGLQDCSFRVPAGRVVALVGPNGAGKTTLLQLAAGLISPSKGTVRVLGRRPDDPAGKALPRVGFLAQDQPLYRNFTVKDLLRFGRHTNPRWDDAAARRRLDDLGIPTSRKAGNLSAGQQTEVALSLCLSKHAELLLLDEPVARLDPLARHRFFSTLMDVVVAEEITVVLSSHVLTDLERVCDFVVILSASKVQVAESIDKLLADHRILIGPRGEPPWSSAIGTVVRASHRERQTTLLARSPAPVLDPRWDVQQPSLEEVVLAYLEDPSIDAPQTLEPLEAS